MGSELHRPVMLREVVEAMAPQGQVLVDVTVGLGGHTQALLDSGAELVIALDRDAQALALARERLERFGPRVELHHARFSALADVLGGRRVGGVLADLGVSSLQLDHPDRGFSFSKAGPLDMRMDPSSGRPAWELLAELDEGQLERLLRVGELGPLAGRLARAIKAAGPIATTAELAAVVERATPERARRRAHHPATLVFQALRLAVNDELSELVTLLPLAVDALECGGSLVVLAYHSLEDRTVKRFVALAERGGLPARVPRGEWDPILVRHHPKALRPRADEVAANPRARSARLRAARKRRDGDLARAWREEVRRWLAVPS